MSEGELYTSGFVMCNFIEPVRIVNCAMSSLTGQSRTSTIAH